MYRPKTRVRRPRATHFFNNEIAPLEKAPPFSKTTGYLVRIQRWNAASGRVCSIALLKRTYLKQDTIGHLINAQTMTVGRQSPRLRRIKT